MPLTKVEGPSLGNVTITNLTTSTSANVSSLTVGANVTVNTSTVFVGNSTANVVHTGSALTVGANVTVNATTVFVGNSSVNTSITAGSVLVNGAAVGGGGSNTGGNGAVQYWSTVTNAIASSANLTFNGTTLSDQYDAFRAIPINTQTTSYTLAVADAGRTISSNANVTVNGAILSANQVFTVYNNSGANITIVSGTGVTMYLAATAATGNRTLAQRGLATIYCVAANTFVIAGAGLI